MNSLSYSIADSGIRFKMEREDELREVPYSFGFPESNFGEIVYYRSYSRIKEDGTQEEWPDTVVRVINGVFTIRKWWCETHGLPWEESAAQDRAFKMAVRMLRMLWLPPGRGLFIMGTDYLYERGGMALYNCAFVEVNDLAKDVSWLMDALMCGCGVGFGIGSEPQECQIPTSEGGIYTIPDTREGWVQSIRLLLMSYSTKLGYQNFDYDEIRPYGEPIKGFGGTASGPGPLKELHERIRNFMHSYITGDISWTRLVADLCNSAGLCVVVGNVRRSAEICMGSPNDVEFMDLKDYEQFPERQTWGWMSNNSVRLRTRNDFLKLEQVADRVVTRGEPGIYNSLNVERYARYGDESYGPDPAVGLNPCGEIPLESYEVCNLSEVFPTRCSSRREFLEAVEDATFYSSTVSLYPTHSRDTNRVVSKNRRVGVSLSGISEWFDKWGAPRITRWLKDGYHKVREVNAWANSMAGVPPSLRVTTVKPSGTISQLTGVPSGMHYPTFSYAIRRMRMDQNNPILPILRDAGYIIEPVVEFHKPKESGGRKTFLKYSHRAEKGMVAFQSLTSVVVEVPVSLGTARPANEVSAWEQFTLLAMLQREWADNSVSCTVYFDKEKEAAQLPNMLSAFVPVIKSVSMLAHSEEGDYPQMPYEGISQLTYEVLVSRLSHLDWSGLTGVDGNAEADMYCVGETCEI